MCPAHSNTGRRLFERDAEFGGLGCAPAPLDDLENWGEAKFNPAPRTNTTLAVIATDAALTPDQARRVAIMAQDGMARAIRPVHTPFDGDVVFVASTGRAALPDPAPLALAELGEPCCRLSGQGDCTRRPSRVHDRSVRLAYVGLRKMNATKTGKRALFQGGMSGDLWTLRFVIA